jgi:signal transduction histidine kinase
MNTLLNNPNQIFIVAIIAVAIIAAVVFVLSSKHRIAAIEPISIIQIPQKIITAQEDETTRLMDRYSICFENNQYVWGAKSFNTLADAINTAEAFIDKISVDFRLPIQAF